MSALDQIVKVNITQETSAVQQDSFSIPLIVGTSNPAGLDGAIVGVYSAPSDLLAVGYTTSDPEYIYAEKLYAQNTAPSEFLVGVRTASVAQVDTFAVSTLNDSHDYTLSINGIAISYQASGSDTQQAILGALLTAALALSGSPVTGAVTGTGTGALLTLTSSVAGVPVVYSAIDADLTHVALTASHSISDDIIAISAVNDTWYGLAVAPASDADILQAAQYIETVKKIFLTCSATSAIGTTATTDVLSLMGALSLKRSGLIFTQEPSEGKECAWMGQNLPLTPGSNNWSYNTLADCTTDVFTSSQIANVIGNPNASLVGKNGNIYNSIGGQNLIRYGKMAGGQYIDITIGIDWLESTLQNNVFGAITAASQLGQKIPYTDKGAAILVSAVKAALDQGVANGLIDGTSIVITVASVSSQSINQRAGRIGPTISFSCRLTGAINSVQINGTVSV